MKDVLFRSLDSRLTTHAPRLALALLALCTLGLASRSAHAQNHLQSLEWQAPAGCPDANEVAARIMQLVGPRGIDQLPRARVVVAPAPKFLMQEPSPKSAAPWIAQVEIETPSGRFHRSLSGQSCEEVTDAVVVVLAIGSDFQKDLATPPSSGKPYQARHPEPIRSEAVKATPVSVHIGAGFALDVGTLPSATPGFGLRAGWDPGAFRLELALDGTARSNGHVESRPTEGAAFHLLAAEVRSCYLFRSTLIGAGPCAGAGMSLTFAQGYGSDSPADGTARVFAPSLGALALWRLTSQLSIRADLIGIAPVRRPTFVIDGAGDVHRPSVMSFRGAVGIELLF